MSKDTWVQDSAVLRGVSGEGDGWVFSSKPSKFGSFLPSPILKVRRNCVSASQA